MTQTDSFLTLCIEERCEDDYDKILSRLFVSYDGEQQSYVVYGKRHSDSLNFEPYFFRTDKSKYMYNFFKFIIGKEASISYTLFNYNNMPFDLEGVDYFFMEENMGISYQLAAYDQMNLNKKKFREMMHVLKKVYNFC
jgi:hypothetical protein